MMQNRLIPFFSIIIPVYNKGAYVERAIFSVLNQKFKDFELIVINDGSNDDSAKVINKILQIKNNFLVITREKNKSSHITRMNGVEAANGKYLIFLDGDDYFTKNALFSLYKIINKNIGYDLYEYGYKEQPYGYKRFPKLLKNSRFISHFNSENFPIHSMCNKVFNAKIIKLSFSNMRKIYFNEIEDLYESIITDYYVKNCFFIKRCFINYTIGVGISTTYKNYEQTIKYLDSIQILLENIKFFLDTNKIDICLNNFKSRLLSYVMNLYIGKQKNSEDRINLYLLLPNYFSNNIILEYLYYKDEFYRNIENIKYSKIYKIGRFFLDLMHKFKG
jgi:glycosyltransferase involved in cell wall biosynthesis